LGTHCRPCTEKCRAWHDGHPAQSASPTNVRLTNECRSLVRRTQPGRITGIRDDRATPARLRRLPSRLLTQTAMHADRLVNEGLARADDRKWHYAVLAALQEFGPASQAALSRRTGIYRSDL